MSYPLIAELPDHLVAENWAWRRFRPQGLGSDSFWVGRDPEGREWLVKMRGSFCAHRERTFAALAQHLGISCQSSTYLKLPFDCEPLRATQNEEPYQLAIVLLPEHKPKPCAQDCPIDSLFEKLNTTGNDKVATLKVANIDHIIDWVRGELLGYLCDMYEPPGRLFTPDHIFFQIDNELMFTGAQENFWECDWLRIADDDFSESALHLAVEVCEKLVRLSDTQLANFARIPRGYVVDMIWEIHPEIINARDKACTVLEEAKLLLEDAKR